MTGAEFRDAGHGLVDRIADWLEALPDGPVTRDESPADVRRARDRPIAGYRNRGTDARRTARRGGGAAVPPLALQRPSTFLRLHHVEPGADRRARRSARVGRQPERRRLAPGADGDRDRSADGSLDCGTDRVSVRGRRTAGQRRQHGELRLLPRRAHRQGDDEGADPEGCDRCRRSFASTPRSKRTPGSRRPPICSASGPTPFDGFPPTSSSGWMPLRSKQQIVGRHEPAETCRFWSSARPDRSAPVPSIRCRRSRLSAGGMTSGFTWTARTARWPRGSRARRTSLLGHQ